MIRLLIAPARRIGAFGLTAAAVLCATFGASDHACAQAWPSKPVRVVVTLSPGSTSDMLARVVSEQLGKLLGQSFVVENRPGAGGVVAAEVKTLAGQTAHATDEIGRKITAIALDPDGRFPDRNPADNVWNSR